jgi:hypothetical protein
LENEEDEFILMMQKVGILILIPECYQEVEDEQYEK